jgi:ABC-type microcin C transport system duplicated ATPase subunit YejF
MTSWGVLIEDGTKTMEVSPWILLFPAAMLSITLYCFNFIGDGMRDAWTPRNGEHEHDMQPFDASEPTGVQFETPDGVISAVNGITFTLDRGKTLGIVGESGSGKSQSVLAMMGLLATNGRATGQVLYQGQDLISMPTADLNRIRGNRVAMIFQDPMTSLNPYLTVERQMTEVLEFHKGMSRRDARVRAIQTLDAVKMPEAARRINMYPHEFSGGMRQRVMIAMALAV